MFKAWTLKDWFAISFAALMGLTALLAIVPGFKVIACWLRTDAAPAWIQAIGSILAIIGATIIASWQTRRAEKTASELRRQEAISKYYSVRALFVQASGVFQIGINVSKGPFHESGWKALIDEIDTVRNSFNSLPLMELPGTQTGSRISLTEQNLRGLRASSVLVIGNGRYIGGDVSSAILASYFTKCMDNIDWVSLQLFGLTTRKEFVDELGEICYGKALAMHAKLPN